MSSLSAGFGQTTYYVANSGNDSNDGRSSNAPLQTITKVNSLALQPGDQVLFRRGDTFRGTLQLTRSGASGNPIVVDAYGSGNKPVLAGSSQVTNWTNVGNNVWQATCSACGSQVTGVYRDGSILPLGRYPNLDASNKGYLTVQSHSGRSSLTSQQALTTNWTGGEAVFRPVNWILNRAKITGQSGNTLQLDGSGSYDVSDGWGYFIQNHPSTLDQMGEWYYNSSNKTIQLYDNQSNPNNSTIAATTSAQSVVLTGASYITIQNVQLAQSINTGLYATNSSNLTINNNDIIQSGEDAVSLQGSGSQILMTGNLIQNANNNGVIVGGYQNVTFRNNTVQRIGIVPGRGKSGDGTYVGMLMNTTANTLIENNLIDNIGYVALNFSTSTTIQRNQISNFCIAKSDGSGLYIWNGNQQAMSDMHLLYNVVYNGIGAPEGTPSGQTSEANGIYLDDCTTNIEVANNTVYNCTGFGIYFHGTSNSKLTNNTIFNNGESQFIIRNVNGCPPRNNVIQGNQFVSRLASQPNAKYEAGSQGDLSNFGQFDNNVYARPFDDVNKIHVYYGAGTGGADISLAQFQSQFGRDLTSSNSPITYASGNPDDYIKFTANPSSNSLQISLDGTYRDLLNKVYTGQVTVAPYSSLVLLKDVNTAVSLRTPDNPSNTTAGLNYSYYEGSWSLLPDFSTLTPIKTGTVTVPNINSEQNRTSNYALVYTGYVSVPTDGVYTFYTSSDDGSKLYIGSTVVVNNDGLQALTERSGTIGLKAGLHAITVQYMQGGGDQSLTISYSGPNLNKQTIPASAYYRVATTSTTPTPTPTPSSGIYLSDLTWTSATNGYGPVEKDKSNGESNAGDGHTITLNGATYAKGLGAHASSQIVYNLGGQYSRFITDVGLDDEVSTCGSVVFNVYLDNVLAYTSGVMTPTTTTQSVNIDVTGKQTLRLELTDGGDGYSCDHGDWAGARLTTGTASTTTTTPTPTPTPTPSSGIYLSDLTWTSATNGYGPVEKDKSNGESNAGDGHTITLKGVTYAKGLGAHASSQIVYNLGGQYSRFITDVGLDDEVSTCGSVVFNVYLDNVLAYTSGLMTPTTAAKSVNIDVTGKQTLRLELTDGGDGYSCDHGDWAGARLTAGTTSTTPTTPTTSSGIYLSDLTWTSATNGYGPVEKDKSNGESNAGDGHTITLNGVTYAKGLGAHAPSEIVYNLGGQYSRFITDVGLDDEVSTCGSAVFNVYVDNVLVYTSGLMTPTTATQSVNVDVTGKQTLRLVITDGGDGYSCDHGDWAGARLVGLTSGRAVSLTDEMKPDQVLQVFPVPAQEELQVRYYAETEGAVSIQLVNMVGESVKQVKQSVTQGSNLIQLLVGELNRGVYILKLTQDKQSHSRKVLLTR